MSLAQLSGLLPLPEDELKQVLDYGATLSKPEAADHFGNLLGDSPEAVDFIASFNSRRKDPKAPSAPTTAAETPAGTSSSGLEPAPRPKKGQKKKKPNIHGLAPRQIENLGPPPGAAYSKKNLEDDYMPRKSSPASGAPSSSSTPPPPKTATPPPPKAPPSAAGQLISDAISGNKANKSKSNSNSRNGSRSSTPGPSKTKINLTGGTAMHGASTALADLDAAIRALEITTNPTTQPTDVASRRCNCVATRHPLLAAAPNCLSCGKVICIKEGLGPCTFCGTPLLSPEEVQSMIRELRAEQGREKQAANREAHKRPDVSRTPAPFTRPKDASSATNSLSEAETRALQHRDRLLGFQAQNARRTTVRDEAADFDTGPAAGGMGNMWASPEERARELQRQQRLLREMEWNARPEYEKRQQVLSIDLVGGKVMRKMAAVERPKTPPEEEVTAASVAAGAAGALGETSGNKGGGGGGTFSRNPLLGGLIKPVFDAKGKGTEPLEGRKDRSTTWRRVQDDLDDNEGVILDGGAYGGRGDGKTNVASDEPNCG